jgi:hypothetical protein
LAKWRVTCFYDTFVVKQTVVLLMNFSAKNPPLRQAAKRYSTSDVLKLTVNTEIASGLISQLDDTSLPIEHQRHYDRRIGDYLEKSQDKWWTIDSQKSAEQAASDIAEIIIEMVIPNFNLLKSTNDLVALWRNGGRLGITEGQRKHYLSLLENVDK